MYKRGAQATGNGSWTGYCIYIIDLSENGKLNIIVNRNSEQYKEESIERDRIMVTILINQLIKKNGENAKLMKMYLARKNKKDGICHRDEDI